MATNAFDDILRRARQELSPDEQLKLVDELSRQSGNGNGQRRMSDLKGLGKEVWSGVDPDDYIRKERDSWSG